MSENLSCYICDLSQLDLKSFFHHLMVIHNVTNKSNEFKCGYKGCTKITKTKKGIREHIGNCKFKSCNFSLKSDSIPHEEVPSLCEINSQVSEQSSSNNSLVSASILMNSAVVLNDQISNLLSERPMKDSEIQMKIDFVAEIKLTVKNLIGTLSIKLLPETTIDLIVKNIMCILEAIFLYIRSNFLTSDVNFMQTYNEFIQFQNEIIQEVKDLSTTYRRRKITFENVPKPQEITLGIRFDRDKKLQLFIEKPVPDNMIYISLLQTLKYLLNEKSNQSYVAQRKTSDDGIYKDINDGSFVKSNTFYTGSEIRIMIHIYVDDFETVNGLGYKTGIHKTSPIYFVMKNLPPHFQSQLKNIHLLALINAQDTKFYGYNNILFCVVQELRQLETVGLQIDFIPQQTHLRGSLVALSGDYIGANGISRMVESCSATYFCRICLVDHDTISIIFDESQAILRTKSDYYRDVENAEKSHSIVNGVKSSCILNELEHFNTIDAPTADIMHDVLEGTGPWDLKIFFCYLTKNKILTESQIIDKIAAFNFGQLNSTSLPNSVAFDKTGIGLKAAQSWCLIRHTPLIFKSIFESNDNKELKHICQLIVLLNQIMNIIFAPKITDEMIEKLIDLIREHHQLYLRVSPSKKLKPKHRFMIHYARIIRKMGPLILLWCMRFEGKHLPFKKLAQCTQNFVNICKTFAFRHQEAFYFQNNDYQIDKTNLSYAKNVNTDHIRHLLAPFSEHEIKFLTKITVVDTFVPVFVLTQSS